MMRALWALRTMRAAYFSLALCTLSACGGGGGSSAPPPPSNFTIGGTVSGLTAGTVVLQNNAGDNLSITADGAFTFSTKVPGGGAYAVSVLTQPPGPDCAVTSGSGTAAANVTNIAVVCTVNPATHFLPLSVTPQGITIGTLDLSVVTSKSLTHAPIRVATDWGNAVGYTQHLVRTPSGKLSGANPAALVYASDTSDIVAPRSHLFALDLSGGSSLVPRQLSNLTVTTLYCEIWMAYEDLDDPASAFLLVGLGTGPPSYPCQDNQFNFVRIRLSDTASTVPFALANVPEGTKQFLYRPDGSYAGMVVCDTDANALVMYHDDSFTTRTSLLDECVNFSNLHEEKASQISGVAANPTQALLLVYMQGGTNQIFRVDHTRTISAPLHDRDFSGSDGSAMDDAYFYYADSISSYPTVQRFLRLSLDGTAPAQILYTHTVPDGDNPMYLWGYVGDQLLLVGQTEVDNLGHRTSEIRTLSKLGPSAPSVIATFEDASLNIFVHKDLLFLNLYRVTPGQTPTYSEESEVLRPDGNVVQPALPGSSFTGVVGDAMQRVLDVVPGQGGGRLESLTVLPNQTLASTILTHVDGSAFTLTEGSSFTYVFNAAPPIAIGNTTDSTQSYGLFFDISKSAVESIRVPDKDVYFVLGGF